MGLAVVLPGRQSSQALAATNPLTPTQSDYTRRVGGCGAESSSVLTHGGTLIDERISAHMRYLFALDSTNCRTRAVRLATGVAHERVMT